MRYIPYFFSGSVILFWLLLFGPLQAFTNLQQHIGIAITMILGAFVAGSTALGGGAVAFPILTKVFHVSPIDAKTFSLAIQSFGMTAASITIIFRKIPFFPKVAIYTILGAIPGVLLSTLWLSKLVPGIITKSLFSLFLIIFSITLFINYHPEDKKTVTANPILFNPLDHKTLYLLIGLLGGMVSGLIGSGADFIIFAVLVLWLKQTIKPATATSVVVMAAISVVMSLSNLFLFNELTPTIIHYVHAAIPVVVLAAPLGAWACSVLPNKVLVILLLSLITIEVTFTVIELLNTI